MKRTISHEAHAAAARLLTSGFTPTCVPPSCGGLNPFMALGLNPAAQWPDIRQAFLARLRTYPPDRHPEEFVHIVDAYDTLKRTFREAAERQAAVAAEAAAADTTEMPTKRRRSQASLGIDSEAASAAYPALNAKEGAAPQARQVIALDMTGIAHVGSSTGSSQAVASGAATAACVGSAGMCIG